MAVAYLVRWWRVLLARSRYPKKEKLKIEQQQGLGVYPYVVVYVT